MRLNTLHLYPMKSAAALSPAWADVDARGLRGDRRWLVVDPSGRFVTGRQCPTLVRIRATPTDTGLRLDAPGMPALGVARPVADAARRPVTVWDDTIDAALAGHEADAWLSRALDRPVQLVYMDDDSQRPISEADGGQPGDEVSFADAFPLLLISQASLDALNGRLARPLPMRRFRPNLVIDGCAPHAEDGWRRLRIGEVLFDAVKPCTRCVFTTIDPDSGQPDPDGEPLRTLKTYRRSERGILFGMNLIPRGHGRLHQGDPVQCLD